MSETRLLAMLGARIRELRLKRNLSQIELAILCDFEKASMSRIESGRTNITVLTLKKISKALDIHLIEFFKDGSSSAGSIKQIYPVQKSKKEKTP